MGSRRAEKMALPLSALILAMIMGGVYWFTRAQTVSGYADSDELILAGYRLALAHPPGYPILVGLLHFIFTGVEAQGLVARANGLMSMISGINVGLAVLVNYWFLELMAKKRLPNWQRLAASVFAAWSWGLTYTIWLHGTVVEVFPLAQLFILITFACLFLGWRGHRYHKNIWERRAWWGATISAALGFFYHPLTILVSGPFIIFNLFWLEKRQKRRRQMVRVGLLMLILASMVTFSLSVYISAGSLTQIWPMRRSIGGWFTFWSRQAYTEGGSAIETRVKDWRLASLIFSLKTYGQLTYLDLSVIGIGFLAWGLIVGWRWDRQMAKVIIVTGLLSGLGLFLYLKFPRPLEASETEYYWGSWLRYRMAFAQTTLFGLVYALPWGGSYYLLAKRAKWIGYGLTGVVIVGLLIGTGFRWSKMDAHHDNLAAALSKNISDSLPEGAWLVVDSDWYFTWQLLKDLGLWKRDTQVLAARLPSTFGEIDLNTIPECYREEVTPIKQLTNRLAKEIKNGTAIFLYMPDQDLIESLGIEGNPFYGLPYGYLIRVGSTMPVPTSFNYGVSKQVAQFKEKEDQWWLKGWAAHLGELHTIMSYYWARLGDQTTAQAHADLANQLEFWPITKELTQKMMQTGQTSWQRDNSYAVYYQAPAQDYLQAGYLALKNQDPKKAAYMATRALLITPDSKEACELYLKAKTGQL